MNEITINDDITVINAKLKTDKYNQLNNAEIAEELTNIGIKLDMSIYKIHAGQIELR